MMCWRAAGLVMAMMIPAGGLYAQAGTIEGVVRHAQTGAPLGGIQVALEGTGRGTLSIQEGGFVLGGVPAGRYTVVATSIGYAPERRDLELQPGQTLELVVELAPAAVELGGITVVGERGGLIATGASTTKIDVPLVETPQAVSVITREQLEILNVRSLGEAARYTPGVQSEPFGVEPRFTFLRIRGFDATTSGLFRDGLQLRNPSYVVSHNLEPYGAERIEVLRGPASVLYGEGSPGGLVNYVTKRPSLTPIREVELEVGSHERLQAQFDMGGPIGGGALAYRLTGLVRESETQVEFVGDDRVYVAPALAWRPTSATSLVVLTHYQTDDTRASQALPGEGLLTENQFGEVPVQRFTGEPGVDRYGATSYSAGYQFEHRSGDNLTLRQNLRGYGAELDDATVFVNALLEDDRTLARAYFATRGELTGLAADHQVQLDLGTGVVGHRLLAGLDYHRIGAELEQRYGGAPTLDVFAPEYGAPVPDAPVFRDDEIEQDQIGVYLQDHMEIGERLVLSLAGRYDWAATTTDSRLAGAVTEQRDREFSGRAGLLYESPVGLSPYVSYSESFLPSLGADADGEPFDPELGRQYEAGVKYQPIGSASFFTVALFDLTRENFIQYDPATYLPVQTGEVVSRGVELEAASSLPAGVDVIGSLTWLDQEITESVAPAEIGRRLTQTPELTASLWADYTLEEGPLGGLGVGAGVRHIGSSYGDIAGTVEVPAATLADAAVHFDVARFRVSLNAQNVFDERHIASAFMRGSPLATFGPERTMTLRLRYRW